MAGAGSGEERFSFDRMMGQYTLEPNKCDFIRVPRTPGDYCVQRRCDLGGGLVTSDMMCASGRSMPQWIQTPSGDIQQGPTGGSYYRPVAGQPIGWNPVGFQAPSPYYRRPAAPPVAWSPQGVYPSGGGGYRLFPYRYSGGYERSYRKNNEQMFPRRYRSGGSYY